MQTLTYGLKKPETPDSGAEFFPALEDNFVQLDAHDHDGVTSAKLPLTSIEAESVTLPSGAWVATSGGTYRQLVTLPTGLQFDDVSLELRLSTGEVVHPTVERASATTFYVYVNDNSVALKAIFTT